MERVQISKRRHLMVFASRDEARQFRDADYIARLAANIASRAAARKQRAAGIPVTRPGKLPRRPACIDLRFDVRRSAYVAEWCAKRKDYWRLDVIIPAPMNPLPGHLI